MATLMTFTRNVRPSHPRTWASSCAQWVLVLARRGCLAALKHAFPMFLWGARRPRSAQEYVVSSARFARGSFLLGARVAPIAWRMSQDSRSRGILALLVRIAFGRPSRRTRFG